MNWNAKPESATMPASYPKNQSSFLQQALINPLASASHSSFRYPASNQDACMYSSNSNPVAQPLLNISYPTRQRISVSDMHNGTSVALQTSVERKTCANIQGPKQLNHSLQMTSGVMQSAWLNSQMRNPTLSHTGATIVANESGLSVVSNQTGFGANRSSINTLQNQLVSSDAYSLQLQTAPSNSLRVPVAYQGNQGLNPSFSERQVDWAHHHTANGLTFPDSGSLPKQYCYSQESFLQDTALQKRNPMLSALLEVKNSQFPNHALSLQSEQNVPVQSYQYVATQIDNRPPPPSYDSIYARQPFQNTQQVSKHSPVEVPQNHVPEMKDFCGSFQQQWQSPNKEVINTIGKFCDLKVNSNVNQPADKVRSLVDSVQTYAQNNQDKRMGSGSLASNPVLDTNATKEGLVRDFKKLVDTRKKLLELARKIKINQSVLMAAGCSKATNTSQSELSQSSELSVKQTPRIQSGPQITPVTPQVQPSAIIKSVGEANGTHCTLNSDVQEVNCKKVNQNGCILPDSCCSEKLPLPDQFHNSQALTLSTSTVETTQTTSNNTQFLSENVRSDPKLPPNSKTITVPQSLFFQEYASKYPNKNTLLHLLMPADKTENKSKNANETIQDHKPKSFEMNQNTQITGELPNLRTVGTQSTSNVNAKVSDKSFFLDHKSSTNGIPSKSDSHCSLELLATCLSLWKKQPSGPTENKQPDESRTNRITICISKPIEVCNKGPCVVASHSHSKTLNNSEKETTLPVVVQNYETSDTNTTKGSELQIAVVSPLILSDVKTVSVKGVTPEALTETVYPVIEEGSVCSLRDQLTENMSMTPLKGNVNELVASNTSSAKMLSLIQKEKQDKSTNCNLEDVPNTSQGKHIKSKSDVHSCPSADISVFPNESGNQQILDESSDGSIMSDDTLQIANICSLVEGDVSYNSQIAKIFNCPSLDKVEPQKTCMPDHPEISCRQQKEQFDKTTESKNFVFQKEKVMQVTDVSPEITDQPKLLPSSESSMKYSKANGEILEENKLECITKKEVITSDTQSAVVQQDSPEIDRPCNNIAQDLVSSEILNDKTPMLYLDDQLSELLKEFPYGIEAINTQEASMKQQKTDEKIRPIAVQSAPTPSDPTGQNMEPVVQDQTCDKSTCDSKDLTSADQIKITIISSEQMKELFPDQDDQPSDGDKLTEPEKEKHVVKVETHCDPKAHTGGEGNDSVVSNSQKDDIHCCALGWLSLIYEGVPQCQCNSIKSSASKEEEPKDLCSLETSRCKQEQITSDRDIPSVESSSSANEDLKTPQTVPHGRNHFPEIKQDKNIEDNTEIKHKNSLKTEKELPCQFPSTCDKKLDPLQSNKRKRKLKFHEVTFHSTSKLVKFSEQDSHESLQKKHVAQNSHPLKAKTVIVTNRSKDVYKKNGSLIQSLSPEKIKLKFRAGGSRYKLLENRKLDQGNILDTERNKKHDKQEQNKNVESSFKLCNSLSNSNERTSIKEKTVSIEVKSTNLEINIHKSLMKSSNVKSSDSKDISCKINRVLTPKEYLQMQKHKEVMDNKVSKKSYVIEKIKNMSCNAEYIRPSKHSMRVETCGKSDERHGSIVQTSKSKIHKSSKNVKGKVGGKQPDKIWMDKTKIDKHVTNINNEDGFSEMTHQTKDHRKQYLNRVAFKCTERESISLSKLDSSPRKSNDTERSRENKPKNFIPVKDGTEKPTMLEFKLCPDVLLENRNLVEEGEKLKPVPRKEQVPVQVAGIKSTKEAWLKSVNTEKRMLEANEIIDKNVLPKSKLQKRSVSADGLETLQNKLKDSKEMFQTYKKMYMEKRSRSLGSSPLQ